ncbi:MAG: ABC transporter permease, partial [Candidatus Rokubacteria bacterium]|nr:ABC transporter permease [Candidatus Rokubacteria bacterium]
PVVQGVNLVIVTIVVTINLVVDMLYALIDPRIRY